MNLLEFFRILWDAMKTMRFTKNDLFAGIGMFPGITMNIVPFMDFASWEKTLGLIISVGIGVPAMILKWLELSRALKNKIKDKDEEK